MIEDKDVHIQVYSECYGYSIEVLNADGDRVLFNKYWNPTDSEELGVGGETNFVELLKFLGYTVYHEEVY
ncbi:MAG: hypothetical protein MJH10_17720 [Epibacterium sp.]|nr:hypothetical protein [Epibacterium sp.]NQX75337.1 hypothetical protein [Epibacterium sp.]